MKQRLRPGMIAVPAAALICALANRGGASLALAAAALCGIVLSLGAGGALRRASGKLTSRQRFLGAGICALCMAAFGAIAGQALAWPLFDGLSGIAAGRLKDLGLANANGQPLAAAWAKLLDAAEEGGQTAPDIAVLRAWLGAGAGFAAGQCVWAMLEGQGSAKLAHAFDAVTFAALTCALLADGSAESALACATGALLVGLIAIFRHRTAIQRGASPAKRRAASRNSRRAGTPVALSGARCASDCAANRTSRKADGTRTADRTARRLDSRRTPCGPRIAWSGNRAGL